MRFFDSHAHYNDEKFNEDKDEVITQAHKDGITGIVCAGYSIESSKKAIEIAEKYDFIYATVGISPNDITEGGRQKAEGREMEVISKLARNNKVVAIGEIGLDYYWNKENKGLQKDVFIKQIELANELDLPIVIHTREAVQDTIHILQTNNVKNKGVFHCCPLNRELVKEGIKLGFYISFAGPVTFKNSKNADEIIRNGSNG